MLILPPPDKNGRLSLRDQIREELSRRIFQGVIAPGMRLPPCRVLANQLGVARATVVNAYYLLVEDGLIESRERSGYFVREELSVPRLSVSNDIDDANPPSADIIEKLRLPHLPTSLHIIERPSDWQDYPYPFVCNQIDSDWFPIAEWRECSRLAMNKGSLNVWSSDNLYADSVELIDQIKCRMLPRRGVSAHEGEILLTLGAQQGLYLVASLFGGRRGCAAIEDPGYPDARNIFKLHFDDVRPIPVDEDGLIVDERLSGCDLVFVTPNRQFPTTVTMSVERREALLEMARKHNFVIVEDDYESEVDYRGRPLPAIHSLDRDGRVIYLSSLSKSLAPGLRIGYMVAQERLAKEARALRGMMIRHPPVILQHTAALFIKLGHQDALISRLHREYEKRWRAASAALENRFSGFEVAGPFGGTSFMVAGPTGFSAQKLAEQAANEGIIVEPLSRCFHTELDGDRHFRLGVSSITETQIEPGIRKLWDTASEQLNHP